MEHSKIQKSSGSNFHSYKSFINKNREGSFFSSSQDAEKPFFSRSTIQPKLTIGQPNDKYEKEADTAAEKVVQKLDTSNSQSVIQSKCDDCGKEEKLQKKDDAEMNVMRKPIFESNGSKDYDQIQTEKNNILNSRIPQLEGKLNSMKGRGKPLHNNTRNFMESAFGEDFSDVHVNTGADSMQMNQELSARAFTHGSNLYFNSGEYNPNSSVGKKLLAHELTHTIQQKKNKISSSPAEMIQKQTNPISVERRQELSQLARNPRNFAHGRRNSWRNLSAAEKGIVTSAMDGVYYGIDFTTAFIEFARTRRIDPSGLCLSRGGVVGEACYDSRNPTLWRTPRFYPQYPNCESLIYPDGTEFARCGARPPVSGIDISRSVQDVIRSIINSRERADSGNLSEALEILEQSRESLQHIELERASELGFSNANRDPIAVHNFLVNNDGLPLLSQIWHDQKLSNQNPFYVSLDYYSDEEISTMTAQD